MYWQEHRPEPYLMTSLHSPTQQEMQQSTTSAVREMTTTSVVTM